MQLEIIRSKRKSLSMQLTSHNRILVRAPRYLSESEIRRFIDSKQRWIDNKRQQLLKHPGLAEDCLEIGGFLYLMGQRVPILVMEGQRKVQLSVQGQLEVYLMNTDSQKVSNSVSNWLRDYTENFFEQELAKQYESFPIVLPPYTQSIGKMRRQWGNCSRRGHIKLNLELIRYPLTCIQYVMQHELCHLIHFHHGRDFYHLLEQVNPDWKTCRERLKQLSP